MTGSGSQLHPCWVTLVKTARLIFHKGRGRYWGGGCHPESPGGRRMCHRKSPRSRALAMLSVVWQKAWVRRPAINPHPATR